jgi:hypothetical protein
MRRCSVIPFLLALAALCASAMSQTLQMADGQVLLAQVEEAYGEGLRIKRLDNGGALELRWDQLSPDCARRVQQAFALVGDDQGEITVQVQEVRYLLNGSPQTVIGLLVDQQNPTTMVVQQKGVQFRIPRTEVAGVRQIEVPVSQVLTPDEFYGKRLAEIAPAENADLHVQLADEMLRTRDYARAVEHLQKAKDLGNSRAPERIGPQLERAKLYVGAKKERDLLDGIQVARTRATARDFKLGRELIARFQKEFPQSKLKADLDAETRRFEEARTRYFSQQVADRWRDAVQTIGDKKLQEPGVTLSAAREYAESKMTDDIAGYVSKRLEIPVEEVNTLFAMRDKFPLGRRTEHFSYGIGSWVLGEVAILKGTKQGTENQKVDKDPAEARELDRIKREIRKMMEQRRGAASGGQAGQEREQTDEEWWTAQDRSDRASWLRAYYAEFGGKLVLSAAYTQPCFACSALGTQTEMDTQSNKVVKVKCYLCHGTKWARTFKAY